MRRTIITIAITASLALSVIMAFAATGHAGHKHNTPTKSQTAKKVVSDVCPVRGEKISNFKKAPVKSVYKGKTYYFCCAECKPLFDKNPTKYIKPAQTNKVVSAVCPVTGSKIPDVTKAAGKSVYKSKTYYFCCANCKPLFDKNPTKYVK